MIGPDAAYPRGTATEKLSSLVKIPTLNRVEASDGPDERIDSATHRRFQQSIEQLYPLTFSSLVVDRSGDHALLLTWPGVRRELPALALCAHWDVVPAEVDIEDWTYPPFSGHIDDEFVWGRGTLDDKVSLVAILEAVETLLANGFAPVRTVCLCLGGDEESGGSRGAATIAAMLDDRGVKLFCLLDEGSVIADGMVAGINAPLALVGIAEKGHVKILLSASGVGDHAGTPARRSAAGAIAAAVSRIERSPFPSRLTYPVREFLRGIASEMPSLKAVPFRHPRLFSGPLRHLLVQKVSTNALVRTTTEVSVPRGALTRDVISGASEAVVNVRILPGETVESAVGRISRIVGDSAVTVGILPGDEASDPVPPGNLHGAAYGMVCEAVLHVFPGVRCIPFLVTASTDSRHYRNLAADIFRFTPIVLRPRDLKRVHGVDERVSHGNVARAVEFYRELIRLMCG
ncbi:MAG TPA: M20/M25/M40 family metallo-hydrolase [Spirochaetia bacterium]|nr:M20/M25/M40 family metallo-hydrolase [Spirochaetia bacterium]